MKTPLYDTATNVQATDADGRVYDGVVRYHYTVPGGTFAYGVEIAEVDGAVLHFPEAMIRKAPETAQRKPGARHHR